MISEKEVETAEMVDEAPYKSSANTEFISMYSEYRQASKKIKSLFS